MKLIERVKERISKNRLGKMFLEEYDFKTMALALLSLIISIAFAIFNGVFGILERSVWYGTLSAYYITLILFRSGVILADKLCKKRNYDEDKLLTVQNKIYLASGAFLVITEIAMAAAVTQMVMFSTPVTRDEIIAITTAAYTFTKIGFAIYNLVRAKKFADPVSRSLRCLNFADACMSMVSLTVVLLTTFSQEEDAGMIMYLKAGAGFAACVAVLALATYMIIVSTKKLRKKEDE